MCPLRGEPTRGLAPSVGAFQRTRLRIPTLSATPSLLVPDAVSNVLGDRTIHLTQLSVAACWLARAGALIMALGDGINLPGVLAEALSSQRDGGLLLERTT